ncbi:hypothetical protein [Metarhizobium album]|uniref:hypothetical protein n=1 Tax=Metarhizobium album TaxID=2182425 RepID=UPI00197F2BDC|nr:hypothetical protein [Rhizobium album]
MQSTDMRDARFYVLRQDEPGDIEGHEALDFDAAFGQAKYLTEDGDAVHVMYTSEATQMQLTRFAEAGIMATPVKDRHRGPLDSTQRSDRDGTS